MKDFLLNNSDAIIYIVGLLIAAAFAWAGKKWRDKAGAAEAIESLRVAVDRVQEDYVIWWKRANADKKLTREERAEARDLAIRHAKNIASGPALKFLRLWAGDKLNSIIARIVEAKK